MKIITILMMSLLLLAGCSTKNDIVNKKTDQEIDMATTRDNKNTNEETVYVDGNSVELRTMNIEVLKSEATDILTKSYGSPTVADKETKFIILTIKATNTLKESFDYDDDIDVLIDNNNRKFTTISPFLLIDDYIDQTTLQPGVAKTGKIVFKVPENAKKFHLIECKGGTNKCFYIPITLIPDMK